MNFIKQSLRIIISAFAGYYTIAYFKIEDNLLSILFYLGIYIAVSLALEMIWREFEKISKKKLN